MNRAKYNLSRLILFVITISAVLLTWVEPPNYGIAIAQTSLVPAPSLQEEQPVELLTPEITIPPEVQSAVLYDADKRTDRTIDDLNVLKAESQQWSDGCLGLGKPDEVCTQAITPGYQVVVSDGLKNWTYRTDNVGNLIRLEPTTNN